MNRLYCWQISYRTAPIELRERCALSTAAARVQARAAAMHRPGIEGCMVVSTCNRTEFYFSASAQIQESQLCQWVAEIFQVPAEELQPASGLISGLAVLGHLSRVASGMDSRMLGEAQVLGQVRSAWKESCDADMADEYLRRLVETAISTARQIRSQTEIGIGAISVPAVAARQYRKLFSRPEELLAVIVGSGKVARLVAQRLVAEGIGQLVVAGRNPQTAQGLAAEVGGEAVPLEALEEHLWRADILVGTSAGPQPVVTEPMVRRALIRRHYKPQMLLDLAIPRDVAADVGQLADAYLVNLDQLEEEAGEELERRRRALTAAEVLVAQGEEAFGKTLTAMQAARLVSDYRLRMQDEVQQEFDRLGKLLRSQSLDEERLRESLRALSRKMMHLPTRWLREVGDEQLLERFADLLAQSADGDASPDGETVSARLTRTGKQP